MAGFEVITYGRIEVITEAQRAVMTAAYID